MPENILEANDYWPKGGRGGMALKIRMLSIIIK
jgi:hypothetical protein